MPDPDAPIRWREPTSFLALRWGSHRTRWLGGLLLIVAGGLAIAGGSASSAFANFLLAAGSVTHVAGWAILPSTGWRRVCAMAPSTLAMWFLLVGPGGLAILLLPYLCWMLVRHRPIVSYATAIFVLAAAFLAAQVYGEEYSGMLSALGIVGGVLAVSAWAARAVHVAQAEMRRGRKPRNPKG